MAERVSPAHFDVVDSKVELDLGAFISTKVAESQWDLKTFITQNFDKLGKDIAELRASTTKEINEVKKDIDKINSTIWWLTPMTGLLTMIAAALVGCFVQQVMPKG